MAFYTLKVRNLYQDQAYIKSEGMYIKADNEIGWKKNPRPQLRRGLFYVIKDGFAVDGGALLRKQGKTVADAQIDSVRKGHDSVKSCGL